MDARELPAHPNLEQYRKQAKELLKAFRGADTEALRRFRRGHPRFRKLAEAEVRSASPALADAQLVIAREHAFESWPRFAKHIEDMRRANSVVSKFEAAADAIVAGDEATLKRLLREYPELVRARSTREHRATLLHYVSANGVEDFRQKTPKNIVKIAEVLLAAGAEVDAGGEMYGGGDTTLGLAATSIHPEKAGVQIPLMELLLSHGAVIDSRAGESYTKRGAVIGCLANGRKQAAEFLAGRGARLDLEGAAGLGKLELVKSYFNPDGSLKAPATTEQMGAGFKWACEYGHIAVVGFLLERGAEVDSVSGGMTGLHWAAHGGHLEIIKLLLERNASLEARNIYGGTVLSQALWSSMNSGLDVDYVPVIEMLIAAGAKVDAKWSTGNKRIDELLRGNATDI
jgi:Ankyrin repeats (3 copies)